MIRLYSLFTLCSRLAAAKEAALESVIAGLLLGLRPVDGDTPGWPSQAALASVPFVGSLAWADEVTQAIARDRLRAALHVHHIRRILSSSVCVVMVGVKNAGKSTMVNRLFGVKAATGFLDAGETRDPTLYSLGARSDASLSVLDFPGTSSKEVELREAFERCAVVSPVCIVVLQPGHVGQAEYEVVQRVREQMSMEDCMIVFNQVLVLSL